MSSRYRSTFNAPFMLVPLKELLGDTWPAHIKIFGDQNCDRRDFEDAFISECLKAPITVFVIGRSNIKVRKTNKVSKTTSRESQSFQLQKSMWNTDSVSRVTLLDFNRMASVVKHQELARYSVHFHQEPHFQVTGTIDRLNSWKSHLKKNFQVEK